MDSAFSIHTSFIFFVELWYNKKKKERFPMSFQAFAFRDLARRGFAVVNFNYRLASKAKFPTPLEDTNKVLEWVVANGEQYHLDPQRLIVIGDSAGAQLTSQYAVIAANPEFAKLFSFTVPSVHIVALSLNCGMYDMPATLSGGVKGLTADYLGKRFDVADPRIKVLEAVGSNYPPAYILTACNDFLWANAQPMADFLTGKGIANACKCYGTPEQKNIGHVFHVDIRQPEATQANDDECAFFPKFL